MEKKEVLKIERKARMLMSIPSPYGEKQAIEYYKKMNIKKNSLSMVYYYILEDANFHTENRVLTEMGLFKTEKESDSDIYNDYRRSGGRTYNL